MTDLTQVESHFAFGKNWASYSELVGEREIEEARRGLLKLLPAEQWRDRTFLDIGCGSGIHALAAASLGVARIQAIDIDPDSVATTRAMLAKASLDIPWDVEVRSVFDATPEQLGTFDIVYSWGVLHHTGDMWRAIDRASELVAPGGYLALALYRSTYFDPFWKVEKRLYATAPAPVQRVVRGAYVAAFRAACLCTGRSFGNYVANYRSSRGMDFYHDVHDWLGGFPYEATLAPEVEQRMLRHGFKPENQPTGRKGLGLFGSGCEEYVYNRPAKSF